MSPWPKEKAIDWSNKKTLVVVGLLGLLYISGPIFILIARPNTRLNSSEKGKLLPNISFFNNTNQRWNTMQIYKNIENFVNYHSNKARLFTLAPKTYEGRELQVVHLSSDFSAKKKAVLVVSAMEGNAVDAPYAAIHMMCNLLEDCYTKARLLKSFDWYIIPLLNPDGYDFNIKILYKELPPNRRSITNDTLWVKNLKRMNSTCWGVNLNRNFEFHWGEQPQYDTCHSLYGGEQPFSESETRAVKDFVEKVQKQIVMFLEISTNDNEDMITYPWHYTADRSPHALLLFQTAKNVSGVLRRKTGMNFLQDQSGHVNSALNDWIMATQKLKYVFSIKPQIPSNFTNGLAPSKIYIEKAMLCSFLLTDQVVTNKAPVSSICNNICPIMFTALFL